MKKTFAVVTLTALSLTGCSLFKPKSPETAMTGEQKQMAAEVMANCKFDKDVCKYMANALAAFSKPFTMTVTPAADAGSVFTTQIDGSGNMSMIGKKGEKEISGMITLGKVTYVKDESDGKWWKYEADENGKSLFGGESFKETVDEMKTKFETKEDEMVYNKLGEEACGSLSCLKYEMYTTSSPEDKTIVWFDKKDYLTRKMQTGSGKSLTTMEYAYGPVTISEPSPVKEMPKTKLPNGGAAGIFEEGKMPSQEDIQKMMKELPTGNGEEVGM